MSTDVQGFAAQLRDALVAGETVACELGVFFTVVWPASIGRNPRTGADVPVPAQREVHFVPSDALLARVGGERALTRADLERALARDVMGTVDPIRGEPIVVDPDDEHVSVRVPAPTRAIAAAGAFDAIASALATTKRVSVLGVGRLERVTVPRGPLRGRIGVAFKASLALKSASSAR